MTVLLMDCCGLRASEVSYPSDDDLSASFPSLRSPSGFINEWVIKLECYFIHRHRNDLEKIAGEQSVYIPPA